MTQLENTGRDLTIDCQTIFPVSTLALPKTAKKNAGNFPTDTEAIAMHQRRQVADQHGMSRRKVAARCGRLIESDVFNKVCDVVGIINNDFLCVYIREMRCTKKKTGNSF